MRQTALLVVLSLLFGLVGAVGTPAVRSTPRAAAAVSATPVGAWSFDAGSGTAAADSVGSHPLTLTSSSAWTPGIRGSSALLASSGQATSGAVLTTSQSFSVTAYVKVTNVGGYQTFVSQDGGSLSNFFLQLRGDNGKFAFTRHPADDSNSAGTFATSASAPVANQWYHLAGVYDASANTLALYVNGRLQQSVTAPTTWASSGSFVVGRGKFGGNGVDYVSGSIDDVRAYSGALTASDVEQIADAAYWRFDEGSGTSAADSGLNGTTATLTNGATWGTGVRPPYAVLLDGSDDVVDAGKTVIDTSKSFTVALWARADVTTAVGVVASLDGSNRSAFTLQIGSDGKWAFARPASDTAGATVTSTVSSGTADAGSWHHLVAVYDSVARTMTLYANGTLQSSTSYTGGWAGTGNFVLGRGKAGGVAASPLAGAVDEVHVYPFTVDAAMVTALAARPVPPVPNAPTATTPSSTSVTLTWTAPAPVTLAPTTGYTVTPYVNGTAGTPQTFNTTATTQTFTGLTTGSSYRYTVAAINSTGTSSPSAQSAAVIPDAVPGTPAAPTATTGTQAATLSWSAPSSTGSAITGYVVTPYAGSTAQPAQSFTGTATTQTVTGLTAGTAYTFRVAAKNAAGTGTASSDSNAVTPNAAPAVTSTSPPAGLVGTAYSYQLTMTGGTSPFTWSVSAGTLPAGITLGSGGLLSGTPTAAGSSTFTVQVTDASASSATRSLTLVVTGKPGTIAAPTATAGVTSATVSWTAPTSNGSAITGYVVTPFLSGTAQTPVSYDATATSRTLTGLAATSSYTFTVAAVNANGTGTASPASNTVIPYDVPAAPSVTSVTAGDTRVTLSWTVPTNNGSAITGYVVTPYIGSTAQTATTFAGTATTQTVTGLTAGTAYTFKVAAQNAAGTGAQSAASASVTPNANPSLTFADPPGAVVGTAYSQQLTVTGGTAPFTWSVASGTLPAGISLSSGGLLSGTPTAVGSSTFTVRVVDASAQSATRSVTLVVTSKPGVVAAPTATAGLTSAVLSWTAPTSNGSTITGYVITPYVSGVAQTPITVDPSAKTRTLNGLTAGSSYTFTVAAVNANGSGTASAASNAVTPYAALSAPAITAVAARTGSATLSWTAPTSTGGSPITGYVVTPYIGSTAQTPTTFASTATTQTITGLTPGTAYTFKVAAINSSGTPVLYRVNAGGAQLSALDGGPDWEADTVVGSTAYHSDTNVATYSTTAGTDPTVPSSTPVSLFSTGRWDSPGGTEMAWTFPVTAGATTKVRLYFVNQYDFTNTVGSRVFDVSLEGSTVLPGFDIIAAAGDRTGTMREFAVTSDGTVNIDFTHAVENPIIMGIEIIRTGVATTGPPSTSSAAVTPNANPTLTFAAPPGGVVGTSYSTQLTVDGGTSPFSWTVASGTLPAGISLSSGGLLSGTPTTVGSSTFTVQVTDASGQTATRSVTLVVTAKPGTVATPTATAGLTSAVVSWTAPASNGSTITGYVITPYISGTAQTPITVDPSAKTRTLNGLTPGSSYTFTVAAVNANGSGTASAASNAVTPYAALSAPTITAVAARTGSATLSWTAPTSTGGSPITGYVVTPYIGSTAQTPTTFASTATTQTITGLTAGTAYTFTVAARNASGTTVLNRLSANQTVTATDGGPDWTDNAAYRSGSSSSTYFGSIGSLDSTVPSTTPAGVFYEERYSNDQSNELAYAIPVASGVPIKVRLYFANSWYGTTTVGSRVFDVALDGTTVLPGFDIIAAAGDRTGTMREFAVTSDGTVNLDFTRTVSDPLINGIEIIQTGVTASGPPSSASTAVTPNANPALTFSSVPAGEVGVAYSTQLTVTGGTAPLTWSVATGTLPTGLSLSSAGLLAGTPSAAGSYTYTVRVTDASGVSDSRSVTQVIAAVPSLAFTPAAGEVNVAYSQQPTLTGGTSPIAWTLTAGSLPAGVTLNATTGLVSGTPTASGTFSVTIRATDSFNQFASKSVSIVIAPLPTLTSTPPKQYQQAGFSFSFAATGGTGPFTYAVVSGSLPSGLSLSSAGVLSGQTNQGSYPFTVRATDAKGQTADDPVTLVVDAPPVQLVKTASSTSVAPGGTVTFTLTATNISSTYYGNTVATDPLADVLDDAVYNSDVAATSGTVSSNGSSLTWAIPLNAGQSASLTYTVTVANPDTGNKILTGTVDGVYSSTSCSAGQRTSACTAAVTVSGLSIATTASVATTTPGSQVTFTTVVTNTGQTPFSAATFNQSLAGILDDATYNGGATATSGSLGYASSTLTWTGALAVGASATITYAFTVANPDTGNHSLAVTAVSSTAGSTCPSGNPAAACSATVTVLVPALAISHSSSVTSTTPGGSVSYTITLANTGETAYTGISATLDLAGVLDDGTPSGGSATSGTLAYDAGAGTLVWTGDIAVGATVTITASATVGDPDPGDKVLRTVVTSSAAGSTCPVGNTSSACRTTVSVLVPALSISASSDVTTTTPGSVVHYSVLVTNSGQTPYTGAAFSTSLSGVLDDATYNSDVATTAGSASYVGGSVSWTGDLTVGASATITYAVTVRNPDPGDLSLTSTVVSSTTGNSCPAGGTDAGCTTTVPVLIPGLSLTSAIDTGASTTPGTTVRYTFTATNSGQTSYSGAVVSLDLTGTADDASSSNDTTASSGTLTAQPNGTVRWVLSLAPGQSATVTSSYRVNNPPSGNKTMTSSATSTAAGSSCPTASAATSCRTSVAVLVPGLTITTSASPTSVTPGDAVAYTVVVTNTGETAYGSVTVTDDLTNVLGDAVYAGGATATSGGTPTYSAPVLSWTGPLALGASATISFSVTVRDPDPGNKQLTNVVTSSAAGSNCPAGGSDTRCLSVVSVAVPALTITKTASAATTTPGATVVYTVKATNSGGTAYSPAAWSDPLAGALDDADYNADASVVSGGGTVAYAASTLSWSGSLAVGASATVTYSVTVHAADTGNDRVSSTVTSTSRGNNCPSGGSDARCTAAVPVARLVLTQTATETTATPGSVVHLSTTWANTGQVPYTGISIVSPRADTSDDTTPTGDQTTSSGTLVRTADAVTWTGDIPVGGTVTGARTLIVKDPDPGNKLITATLRSTAPGNNCPTGTTDTRCTFAVTVLVPGLSISKVASTTATVPGGTVTYTITAHNTGQTSYPAATLTDSLAGVLDDSTYNNASASASSGTLSYAAPTLSWTGALAVDQTVTITYTVTVKAQPGDKTMINPVTSDAVGNNCPTASSDAACRSTVVVLTPGLTIVKTADVANATLGSTVTYTVKVTNSGQTPYAGASFSDSLSGVLDDATYGADATATSGTVGYASSTLSWSGALNPGASATITYSVTIDSPASGDRSMGNTVVSTTTGNNCPAGTSDSRCTATVAVTNAYALTLTKTADVLTTAAGQVVTYTVTAANASGSAIVGADFSDPLAGIDDDAAYDDDAVASSGTVALVSSTLEWSGTVAAGSTVTVTYSVTVDATATGDQILSGQLVSTSPVVSNNCLVDSVDPRCASAVPVAALVISQAYTELTTTPGSLLHLSATFINTGKADYNGITISSASAGTVDDAIPTGDQVATSGSLVLSATAITWTGDIPVGGSVTVTGTVTVKNPDPGDKQVTGTLVSAALGNNCPAGGSDARCTALSVVKVPQLSLSATTDKTFVVPGEQVDYTLTVANTGETAYTGAVVTGALAGVLDDGVYGSDAAADAGAVSVSGSTLTWTGDLAVGQTVTITYSVTAREPATGDKSMVTRLSSTAVGSTCPPGGTGSACQSSVDVRTPGLTVSTTADSATADPGDQVTFTVTAENTGQTDYPAGTQIVLPFDGLSDDATYAGGVTASTGTVALGSGGLTWTGALAIGDTVTIEYSVTVDDPVTGDHLVESRAVSGVQGSNCPSDSLDPRCSASVAVADLHMSDVTNVSVAQPRTVVRFTETYTNSGQVPFYGLRITIDGRDVFDDATYNGDATPSAGSLALDPDTGLLQWTGDLPVGASVTTTGSVTVNNPTAGNKHLRTRISTTDVPSNCPPDSTDGDCLIDVPVLTPALSIVKTADTTTTTPGSDVAYTVTVTNTGETAYTGAVVTDDLTGVLDDATIPTAAQASTGDVGVSGSTLTWTGDLDVGDSATITYTVRVRTPDPGDLNLVNRVTSDEIGSTCPSADPGTGCTSLVTVLIPALDITVTPSSTTTYPGGQVGYTLTIRNAGQAPYVGASVSAELAGVLDDATYEGDGQADVGTVGFGVGVLTWTGDLAVDQTAIVTYSVIVLDPDPGNKLLLTSVSSPAPGSTCTPDQPCTSSVVVQVPGLSVYTSADVATATPGSQVTYTTTMTNNGQRAYLATTTTISLADVLDDATFDGEVSASSGLPVYTGGTITWMVNLAVGAHATITYTVTVRDPSELGDKSMSATVRNASAGSPCRAGSTSPACTATVQVLVPSLALAVSSDVPTTTPGSVVHYTFLVTNDGEAPYTGAVVKDELGGLLTNAAYNADAQVVGGGVLDYGSGTLSWTGDLAVGATATITFSVTVNDPATGDRVLLSAVSSDAQGSTCPPGSTAAGCVSTVQVLVPGLLVGIAADRATVVAGSPVDYTVTLRNTGETPYAAATASWSLAGVLDDGTYPGDATATSGTVAPDGDSIVWGGALGLDETVTITYSIVTAFPAVGNRSLDTVVTSASVGSSCVLGTEDGCAARTTVLVPALTVTKAASASHVVPRGTVGYTVTALNTGEAPYTSAALVDDLGGVLDHATYAGDATATTGTVGVDGSSLTWTGGLGIGDSVVITYSVVVDAVVNDPAALDNRVSSTSVGSTCPIGNSAGACSTTTTIDPSTLELSNLTQSFTVSGTPGSTVSLDNAVVGTVITNSLGGYVVSVRATSAVLTGQTGNTDAIPVENLRIRENDSKPYEPLSTSTPVSVYSQDRASAPGGDAVSTDYQVQIPDVNSDTYSVTVEYVVTAQ